MGKEIEVSVKEFVNVQDIINHLRMSGVLNQILRQVFVKKLAEQKAREKGIEVSNFELQKAADEFRKEKNLLQKSAFQDWLRNNDFSLEDFEKCLERDLLAMKIDFNEEDELDESHLKEVVGGALPMGGGGPMVTPYATQNLIKPNFNPYAEENAVAGVRG